MPGSPGEESGKRRDSEEAEISSRREFEAERAVEQERLRKDREVQQSAIESELSVDLARIDQQRVIAGAEHSREETRATAKASAEKVQAVATEENLITQRDSLRHERDKMLELIEARKNAEKSAGRRARRGGDRTQGGRGACRRRPDRHGVRGGPHPHQLLMLKAVGRVAHRRL